MLDPKAIRRKILDLAYRGQTAHTGCAFSIVEMICLVLNEYPNDDLILSKGHGVMALYAAWYLQGKISDADLANYGKSNSKFKSLCETPFITGSLGHGLPIAAGIAYAHRLSGNQKHVFCIVGDGEMQEGSIWEALQFIAREKLHNLIILVDANGHQAMERLPRCSDLEEKIRAFGIEVSLCEGHDMKQMGNLIHRGTDALVCDTIKGKGISFMEDDNTYHYKKLTPEIYEKAMAELAE